MDVNLKYTQSYILIKNQSELEFVQLFQIHNQFV